MIDAIETQTRAQTRAVVAGRWLLAAAIACSALAVGTVHTSTLCVAAAVLGVAVLTTWWRAEEMNPRPAATVLLLTGTGLIGYTFLQCIPMPLSWLAVIAPHNADVWSRALSPLGEPGPRWAPLSLDPIATHVEILKGVVYLMAFVVALRVARSRDGVGFLSLVIIGTGAVLAAAALLHPAFKVRRLFGVYDPGPTIWDRHIAPLMNPNNLAGYLNVSLCFALAGALAPRPRMPRIILAAVALLLAATQVWVASRAGVLTMVLGAVVVATVLRLQRSPRGTQVATLSIVSGCAAAIGSILVVLAGSEEASNELFEASLSKLHLFEQVLRMIPAMPLFGCGRGAFESAFPAFRDDPGHVTFTHPENVIVQWIVEWGIPVGTAGLAAVAFSLRPTAVIARSTTAAGAWSALVALSVQNLGDLGTEVPGLMLTAVVCAAVVVAGSHGRSPKWAIQRWARAPRRVVVGALVGACISVAWALLGMGHELGHARRTLHDAAIERNVSAAQMHAMARAEMLNHPAEPCLPFVAGLRASYHRDDNPLPWVAGALERARVYGPAHLVVARTLAARSPSQARLEYRLTMEQTPSLVGLVMTEAPRVVGRYGDATELLPAGRDREAVVGLLIEAAGNRLPATSVRLDDDLLISHPASPGPVLRAARDAVADLEADDLAPWCREGRRPLCERVALEQAERATHLIADRCESYELLARARLAAGEIAGAFSELESATDHLSARVDCLERLFRLAQRAKNPARARAALDRVVNASCLNNAECANNLRWAATQEAALGDPAKAFMLYRRAYEQAPDDVSLEQLARSASALGLHTQAADYFERLLRRHPENKSLADAAADERAAALRGAVKL